MRKHHDRRQSRSRDDGFLSRLRLLRQISFSGILGKGPFLNAKVVDLTIDSRNCAAVTIIFSGPDPALELANRDRFVLCSCSSFVETVVRDDQRPGL